jgi:hypothetical protein
MEITKEMWLKWAKGDNPKLHKYLQYTSYNKLDNATGLLKESGINILFECVKYYDDNRIDLLKTKLENTFFNELLMAKVDGRNIFMIAMGCYKDNAFAHIVDMVEEEDKKKTMLVERDKEGLTVPMHALVAADNLIKKYGESTRNYADSILTRKIEIFTSEAGPGLAEEIMSYKDNNGENYLMRLFKLGCSIKPLMVGCRSFRRPFWELQAKSLQEMLKGSSSLTNEMIASAISMPEKFVTMVIASDKKEEQLDITKIKENFMNQYSITDCQSLIETSQKLWATEAEERLNIFAVINKSKEVISCTR